MRSTAPGTAGLIGDSTPANTAQEYGIEPLQDFQPILWHHDPILQIEIAAPIKAFDYYPKPMFIR
jgi:hypothetical protein